MAAEVAAATAGLVNVMHIPNGAIFTMGLLSIILAIGCDDVITALSGKTVSVPGAAPKVHCSVAPLHTAIPIFASGGQGGFFEKAAPLDPLKNFL
jgi:hypothetical protein